MMRANFFKDRRCVVRNPSASILRLPSSHPLLKWGADASSDRAPLVQLRLTLFANSLKDLIHIAVPADGGSKPSHLDSEQVDPAGKVT